MNFLGFFLADVQNSRGKFDEIKEKFAINPAPIASQSRINAGDHNELEIFLEICLISSRIDQKLKNNEEQHGALKGEIGPKIVAIELVVRADLRHRGRGSLGRLCSSRTCDEFFLNLASISLHKNPRSRHDRATITPQSGHDRASIVIPELSRSPSNPIEMIPQRKTHDRGLITTRSQLDWTAIVEFFHESSPPFDGVCDLIRI